MPPSFDLPSVCPFIYLKAYRKTVFIMMKKPPTLFRATLRILFEALQSTERLVQNEFILYFTFQLHIRS